MITDINVMKACYEDGFTYTQYVEAANRANVYVHSEKSFNEITGHWARG